MDEVKRGGPFVGHTLGPPWRLIACNALEARRAKQEDFAARGGRRKTVGSRTGKTNHQGTRCYVRHSDPHDENDNRTSTRGERGGEELSFESAST